MNKIDICFHILLFISSNYILYIGGTTLLDYVNVRK